ncbi:MAG: hypothetical protein ACYC4U_31555 [Pirellulaceae bacterium]
MLAARATVVHLNGRRCRAERQDSAGHDIEDPFLSLFGGKAEVQLGIGYPDHPTRRWQAVSTGSQFCESVRESFGQSDLFVQIAPAVTTGFQRRDFPFQLHLTTFQLVEYS